MFVFGAALVATASLATPASATSSVTSHGTHNALRGSSGCGSPVVAGTTTEMLDVAGAPRQFRLAVPSEPTGKRPLPLILNFHGAGRDDATQANYSQLEEKGPARGFVVITPNAGSPAFWIVPPNPTARFGDISDDNLAFTTALIGTASAKLCIDLRRVYVTGFSNGAGMSASLGCKLSPKIAAIAPVAGVNLVAPCAHGKPMSVVAFHGTADASYEGGSVVFPCCPNVDLLPVEAAVQAWAQRAECATKPSRKSIGQVERIAYRGCGRSTDVVLYKVANGAHNWPGSFELDVLGLPSQDINAADLILDFFAHHPRAKKMKS